MKWYHQLNDRVGDYTRLPSTWICPLVTLTYGCGVEEKPDFGYLRLTFGPSISTQRALYYNGSFFLRVMFPFYIGLQVRWARNIGPVPEWVKKATFGTVEAWPDFMQVHVGWKLNGDLAFTFRLQTDYSAFKSDVGPERDNWGQAQGWACGTK